MLPENTMRSKTGIHGAGLVPGVRLDEDRISTLPDHLLHHILSFMRTQVAVRTSVLSRRWQRVWIGLPSFAFSDDTRSTAGFADSVDKVLGRSRSHHVDVIWISIRHPLHIARANVWLQQAVERVRGNISIRFLPSAPAGDPVVLDLPCGGRTRSLSLHFSEDGISGTLRVPPASAAVSSSLTELKLELVRLDGSRFSDFVSFCCPHLRKLRVHTIGEMDYLNLCNDALEDLALDSVAGGGVRQLQVSSRNLRCLCIGEIISRAVRSNQVHGGGKVAIFHAPRLDFLDWSCSEFMHPSMVEFADSLAMVRRLQVRLITHAWVEDTDYYHNKLALWLLQHCTAVRCLKVTLWNSAPDPMEALGVHDEASLAQYEDLMVAVPQLSSVTNLIVITLFNNHEYGASIATLLSRCNYIETLTIDVQNIQEPDYYACLDAMCWCKCPANWGKQKLRLDYLRKVDILGFTKRAWWMSNLAGVLRRSRPKVLMRMPQIRWWWVDPDSCPVIKAKYYLCKG